MLKSMTYNCPECVGQFRIIMDPKTEPPPRYCPLCGFDAEADDGQQIQEGVASPHIRAPIRDIVDNQYRAIEDGSEMRAVMAKEKFGLDDEAANALKITNLKDNLREGDTSYVPVNNAVSQMMAANPGLVGFQPGSGVAYSGTVNSGPAPNAGGHTAALLRRAHAQNFGNVGHAGAVTSSMPGLETTSPNYATRVRDW